MANPSKRKGTAHEVATRDYLKTHGQPYCERLAQSGNLDRGDLSGIPGIVVECKNEKSIDLARYMDEVRAEKANAGVPIGVAIVKRRGKGIERAYAVMELADLAKLIGDE